ncbi:unnamed protein product [Pleuronectes platessa]|uniref:Uncharacterized protein n=1 Tax=Pleuronectes platessa TaxID=8262 RepID=A0A9N7UHL8_PLEPL|nr:unnamed protein product [Pleuronectes platessa]
MLPVSARLAVKHHPFSSPLLTHYLDNISDSRYDRTSIYTLLRPYVPTASPAIVQSPDRPQHRGRAAHFFPHSGSRHRCFSWHACCHLTVQTGIALEKAGRRFPLCFTYAQSPSPNLHMQELRGDRLRFFHLRHLVYSLPPSLISRASVRTTLAGDTTLFHQAPDRTVSWNLRGASGLWRRRYPGWTSLLTSSRKQTRIEKSALDLIRAQAAGVWEAEEPEAIYRIAEHGVASKQCRPH